MNVVSSWLSLWICIIYKYRYWPITSWNPKMFRYWYFIQLCKLKHASYVTENFLHAIYTKLFKMYWYFRSNSFRCCVFIKCSFCASLLTSKCVVSILTKNVCVFTFEKVKWNIFSQWTILNHINSARGIFSNLAILHYG